MTMYVDLMSQLRAAGLPAPEAEYAFHPARRWRFDWAWPERRLAVEHEGGTWSGGRHVRGAGYAADCLKYNEAALAGWTVLRFTSEQIGRGLALEMILRAFGRPEKTAPGVGPQRVDALDPTPLMRPGRRVQRQAALLSTGNPETVSES